MHRDVSVSQNQYGKQYDIVKECLIRYSEDTDSIRIFFGESEIPPIYVRKDLAAYKALKKHIFGITDNNDE
jgi:hypothetical protein